MWNMAKIDSAKAILVLMSLAAALSLGPAAAGAQETGKSLTLKEAIDLALKQHPTLKESQEKMAAARYQIGVSQAAYFPQVTHISQYYRGNAFLGSAQGAAAAGPSGVASVTGSGVPTNFFIERFSVNQLIFDFGKTYGNVAGSKATFETTREDYAGNRQQVVLDARTAYFGLLAAQRALKVQQETVRQNQELLKQAQGFYQVGLKAKIDVTKAEANLYDAESGLIQAKNAVELAKVSLMTALGMKTWPYQEVEDVMEVTPIPTSQEELKAQALKQRPELLRNRYLQDAGQAAVTVARAGYFPVLSSTASYGLQGNRNPLLDNWWVGVGVNFPLFEGLATTYNYRVAKANLRATVADAEVIQQNVTKEVDQAYLDLVSGWDVIRASKKALEAARENLRLAWGRYQAGVGTIIEVTDAQVQFSQSDLKFVQALYNYRVFEARLDKAIGKEY